MAQPTISGITIVHSDGRKEHESYSADRRGQDAALGVLTRIRDGQMPVRTLQVLMSDGTTR